MTRLLVLPASVDINLWLSELSIVFLRCRPTFQEYLVEFPLCLRIEPQK